MSLANRLYVNQVVGRLGITATQVRNVVDPLSFFVVVVVLWQFGVEYFDVPSLILPTPVEIYDSIVFNHEIILQETVPTVQYILYGFIAGSLIGIVSAVGISYSKFFERAMYPILIIGFVVPKIVLAPVIVFFTGAGLIYFTLIPVLLVYFPVLENTTAGLKGIDENMNDLTDLYGASGWFTFWNVQVPHSIPFIMAGLKIGITQSVIGVVIAEFIAPEHGLGSVIMIGQSLGNTRVVFAGIIFIAVAGIIMYKVIELFERWFVFWEGDVEDIHR